MEAMIAKSVFPGKLGLQQRVLPTYRKPFIDRLARRCQGGMSVFAGEPRRIEQIQTVEGLEHAALDCAENMHLFGGGMYFCIQRGLRDWLVTRDPDVVILEANPRYPASYLAVRWMHARGRPVIGWGLGSTPIEGLLSRLRLSGREWFLNQFDALIAYSTQGKEQYLRHGFPEDRIFVALNAVSPPPSKVVEREPIERRSLRVLFVGRLQARKRVDLLLRACSKVNPAPELWIVGEGPAREELTKLAEQVCPQAHFAGAKHGPELERYFTTADVFVLPGTGGLAMQEAMYYGLPVIIAKGDGTQRDLVSEQNGWLLERTTVETFAQALQEAVSHPDRLISMGRESQRVVIEKANIDIMADIFTQALNTTMKGR
jgi:glycosyltransferase involved in cell wall biosynthesis